MNKTKNILISGYYGFNNAGDELVLQEIIRGLSSLDENNKITVLSAAPKLTSTKYDVESVNRWEISKVLNSILKTDYLISGGGSLLQDKTSKNGILYYLGIILVGRIFRKKIIIFSQGIGPVTSKRNIFLLKNIISLADYISVRDKDSFEFLKRIGVKKEIVLSGDPVFLISSIDGDKQKRLWKQCGLEEEKKLILVSLRPWDNIEKIIEETQAFLEEFDRKEYQIKYLAFHQGEDEKVLKNSIPEMDTIKTPLMPEDFITLIGSSFLTVGMRLHSLILAAALEIPFISISYDPKVSVLDKEIYNSEINISTNNISREILLEKYQYINSYKYSSEELKERAKLPFKYFKGR